jgi:hypothetical protein
MKQQVKNLVIVQELDSLVAELGKAGKREQKKALGEAERLRAERARIAASLSAELLQRYERLRKRYPRAVVATERGVCLGCFTRRPTALASRREGGLETCERCGRILFRVEVNEVSPAPGSGEEITAKAVRARVEPVSNPDRPRATALSPLRPLRPRRRHLPP